MRTILAIICFLATILHGFFGYYIYLKGESIFEPEGMIVAVEKKLPAGKVTVDVFKATLPDSQKAKETPAPAPAENLAEAPKAPEAAPATAPEAASAAPAATAQAQAEEEAWYHKIFRKIKESPLIRHAQVEQLPDGSYAPIAGASSDQVMKFTTGWVGFLQVENALMGIITLLLGCCVCMVCGKGRRSRWVFFFNFLFWTVLTGLMLLFQPVNTPLAMLKLGSATYPQWLLIAGTTAIAAILSFFLILFSFGKGTSIDAIKADLAEAEAELKETKEAKKEAEKQAKLHREAAKKAAKEAKEAAKKAAQAPAAQPVMEAAPAPEAQAVPAPEKAPAPEAAPAQEAKPAEAPKAESLVQEAKDKIAEVKAEVKAEEEKVTHLFGKKETEAAIAATAAAAAAAAAKKDEKPADDKAKADAEAAKAPEEKKPEAAPQDKPAEPAKAADAPKEAKDGKEEVLPLEAPEEKPVLTDTRTDAEKKAFEDKAKKLEVPAESEVVVTPAPEHKGAPEAAKPAAAPAQPQAQQNLKKKNKRK